MSLTSCIRKAGKALTLSDATAIKSIYAELTQGGMPASEAARSAVDEYIVELQEEHSALISRAESMGGDVSAYRGSFRLSQSKAEANKAVAEKLSVLKYIPKYTRLPGSPEGRSTGPAFAKLLSARARKLNRGQTFAAKTARNKDIISETMTIEVEGALARSGNAADWYSNTLRSAVAVASLVHPEINTDSRARTAFLMALAVTSNGVTVEANTKYAENAYSYYKAHGKFKAAGYGDKAHSMKNAFQLFNEMEEKYGSTKLRAFLNTEFTVSELKLLGLDISGENSETLVYGSAIFGPKIGQGFFQNLNGNFSPLTMDRWWMRTWGRMVGNLAPEGWSAADNQARAFRTEIALSPEKVIAFGYTVDKVLTSDKALAELANKTHKKLAQSNYKDRSTFNMKAKVLDLRLNEPILSPRNGAERSWIREVSVEALNKLKAKGIHTNMASLQALLWYPEKEFYLNNGVGKSNAKPTDYSREFAALAGSRGIDQSRIDAAISQPEPGRGAGGLDPAGEAATQVINGPTLAAKARKQLIQLAAARQLAGLAEGAFSTAIPKGTHRAVDSALVANVHAISTKAKNILTKAGLAAPSVLELAPSVESGKVFRRKLLAAKKASPYMDDVDAYSAEQYEDMRTFLTPDGSAGFSLKDDEILSMFKHPKSSMKGATQALIKLATEQGGRKLDTFDTANPHIYSLQGFKASSRVKFEGATLEGLSAFNKGRPDVVWMNYDRHDITPYAPGDGVLVATAEEAINIQTAKAAQVEPSNYPKGSILLRLSDKPDPIVNQQPDSPLSQVTKLAATVEEQKRYNPGSAKAMKDAFSDVLLGTNAANLEAVVGAIPRRNLKDFVSEDTMPSANLYVRQANRMAGRTNELLAANEVIGERWTKYVSRDKNAGRLLGELMHASTLAAVDPSKKYTPLKNRINMTDADKTVDAKRRADWTKLRSWWDRMDAEGKEIYSAVRVAYLKQRLQVEQALISRIEATEADGQTKQALMSSLRKQFEGGRVAGPYFPLARFGELWASAKDSDGEVIAFSRFEKVSEQREWAKNFKDGGFNVEFGKKQDNMTIASQLNPEFVTKVTKLADAVDSELADEIWQLYLKSLPEMSMRKAFLHRKGRLGFTADALRSFGHHTFHGSHQLAKLEYMHQLDNLMLDMKAESAAMEKADDPDALWGNAIYREMTQRHQWAKAPKNSTMANKLTSLGFAWYLGATPAAALVNLSQTAIVGLPVLSAKFSWSGASAHLMKAAGLYASSRGPMSNRLRGEERDAMMEAERIGLFDKTQAHDLAGVAEEGMDYGSKRRKAMKIISWMFHKMEEANRQITFLAAYRLGREKKFSHNEAVITAEDLTWDAHFDYNNVNRPRYMQSDTAKVLLLFRQYSMNMTYRLARDLNDSMRGSTPGVKKEAFQRLGGILGMTGLFAGVSGLPLYWIVEGVMSAIGGDEDEPYDFTDSVRAHIAQTTSPSVADIIMKGPIDYLTGATVSSRVSLNNLWVREAPASVEGEDKFSYYLGELAGPIPAIVKDVLFKAPQEAAQGNYQRALEYALPKAMKDFAKTMRYLDEGLQNRRGDVILSKDELTNKDLITQAMGFTPSRVTREYEQARAVKNVEQAIIARRKSLMDHLAIAVRHDDKKEIASVMKDISQFGKKNPTMAIAAGNIIASAKSRASYSRFSQGGVTINKKLLFLNEKMRFTPKNKPVEE